MKQYQKISTNYKAIVQSLTPRFILLKSCNLIRFFYDMNVWLAECFIYEFEIFLFSYW